MTDLSSTISPRRRSRASDVPVPVVAPTPPITEIEAPLRVLIRMPAIATAMVPTAKPAVTDAKVPSATRIMAAPSWFDRLTSPRVKEYLPYVVAVAIVFGAFLTMRRHSGKSQPSAAESDAPAWKNGAALPNRQAGAGTPAGPGHVPNWNAPTWQPPNGIPQGTTPSSSPSAYQQPAGTSGSSPISSADQGPTNGYQSNVGPANAGQGPSLSPPSGAAGGPPGSKNDSVPPMPAHPWDNPAVDQGVVQGGSIGPEIRTAQTINPATIPPGRGTNDPGDAGAARFLGTIAPPSQQ